MTREQRSNGADSRYSYDANDWLTNLLHFTAATTLVQNAYQRDALGNVTNLAQLAGIIPSGPVYTAQTVRASYDWANGLWEFNSSTNWHDADGNLTNCPSGSWTAAYDPANRLTALTRRGTNTTYSYDGLGHRIRAARGAQVRNFHHDVWGRLLFETDASNQVTAAYIYDDASLVAMQTGGANHFYHFDHNGNTVAMTDDAGKPSAIYRYLPYGGVAPGYARVANPFTWVGRFGVMDEGNNLYYMRARYYDADIGQFISRDPIGFRGGFNPRAYADGDPVNRVDPHGWSSYGAMAMYLASLNTGDKKPAFGQIMTQAFEDSGRMQGASDMANVDTFYAALRLGRAMRMKRESEERGDEQCVVPREINPEDQEWFDNLPDSFDSDDTEMPAADSTYDGEASEAGSEYDSGTTDDE